MNYFLKYRYAVWTIIVLGVIIITALVTSIMVTCYHRPEGIHSGHYHNIGRILHEELGLSVAQDKEFKETHQDFIRVSHSIFKQLEDERILLIRELSKPNPDTVLLYKISDNMGQLHAQLKHETVNHLLRLRAICTPEQVKKLNIFYTELIAPEGPMRKMEHRKPEH